MTAHRPEEVGLTDHSWTAVGLLGMAGTLPVYGLIVLAPDIARDLAVSVGAIAGARTLGLFATSLLPLPVAALTQPRHRRRLCLAAALAWSVLTLLVGVAPAFVALAGASFLEGALTGSAAALHAPLLVDTHPPTTRVRALSGYYGFVAAGWIVAPALVALLHGAFDLSWRAVFVAMGVASVGFTLLGATLPEADVPNEREHRAPEMLRRLSTIPTVRSLLSGYVAVGFLLVPMAATLSTFLDREWGMGLGERNACFAVMAAASVAALVAFAPRAERWFRADPSILVGLAAAALAGSAVAFAVGAVVPVLLGVYVLFALGAALVAVLLPSVTVSLLSIVEARYRPFAGALAGMCTTAGSLVAVLYLGATNRRYGVGGSIVSLVVPCIVGALLLRRGHAQIVGDLDRMTAEARETDDVRLALSRGGHLPMLSARGIDFSYGQLQVLFDVNLTVDDGEMVALLGTNGAGKSTLLRTLSGTGLPSRGTVRFRGRDITYLDAERRVRLGITQIPGGRAVFGPMDVVENLRVFGHTVGRNRQAVDALMDGCFEAFPRLYERRTSLAATLSGGEQQMLGLSKALILQPELLLIDELSLGLAPIVVGQLLEMVRRINATGTAVVLVEQSVNIALTLVQHAYFMEKGEMRFDGTADELLTRGDLLRAVFLEGATSATAAAAP